MNRMREPLHGLKIVCSINNHGLMRALGMEVTGPEYSTHEVEVEKKEGGWDLVNSSQFIREWRSAAGKIGGKIAGQRFQNSEELERHRQQVINTWVGAAVRRAHHATIMKETWAKGHITAEMARKNGSHGLIGKDNPVAKHIEYKGVTYYGWDRLEQATGVSKHLYRKYYIKGIDPEFRIKKNGPIPQPMARRV